MWTEVDSYTKQVRSSQASQDLLRSGSLLASPSDQDVASILKAEKSSWKLGPATFDLFTQCLHTMDYHDKTNQDSIFKSHRLSADNTSAGLYLRGMLVHREISGPCKIVRDLVVDLVTRSSAKVFLQNMIKVGYYHVSSGTGQ
ncbi:hypothetical protein J1614_003595 [Plenodomus biglobosus]|nr:hypothetical protein J1614_003595 [Plenodomus biglobosus]